MLKSAIIEETNPISVELAKKLEERLRLKTLTFSANGGSCDSIKFSSSKEISSRRMGEVVEDFMNGKSFKVDMDGYGKEYGGGMGIFDMKNEAGKIIQIIFHVCKKTHTGKMDLKFFKA